MGRISVSRAARARAGTAAGGALVAVGAGLGLGLAVGLAVAGVLLVAYNLLLADVDPPQGSGRGRT
ncbi:hypothetical protein AVW11_04000 [Streptomyces amritsarensis]|uniref:Integral membrane protein n=1 Tax=Streptomyces amritsarensis TaxID=681158 RepID=A0ABX3G9M8_9ACTN|nr:hypothetical protein [Streptomyces amritsarensis]OLZ72563.1 hypothetical protein AVW11_04000 [Streptomyces amritsarensis]